MSKETTLKQFKDIITLLDTRLLLDALDSVTHYNGLAEEVIEWKNLPLNEWGSYSPPEIFSKASIEWTPKYQCQVIWMILVFMFGDYGTSPRFGWIEKENKEQFDNFIDEITKTYQEKLGEWEYE